ncbi:microtubule-associated protein futsch-like isoform X1 [Branchiostoma floridae]|uniref:Microtubule-associated protein futsch-like isoform X1 n=1 Tax=Branchiostoma floridae TaxID=7739 RepID=A0A9J7LAK9_BRAFL|nr:microtubule-associated protein futsch-like isoform X1 [Branchiostoma floridae]
MKTEYIQALSKQRPALVNEMDPLPVISTMVNKGLLKQRMADYMLPEDVRRQLNERMINALPPQGEPAYDILRDTLKGSGQGFLADTIDKTEKKTKGTTEEAVTVHRNLLLQNMQPLPLYRTLVDSGMVKDADVEELLTKDKKKKLNEKLLTYLTTRSNEGHEAFLGVLRECGQGKQADGLDQAASTAEKNTEHASNRSSFAQPQAQKTPTSQPAKSPAPATIRKDTKPPSSQPTKPTTPANIREDTKPSKMDTTTTLTKREAPTKDKSPLAQSEQKPPGPASPETKRARLEVKPQTNQDARRSVSPEKYNVKDFKPGTRIRWRETPQSALGKWGQQLAASQDAPPSNKPGPGEQTSKDEPSKERESRTQGTRNAPSRAPDKAEPTSLKPQDKISSSPGTTSLGPPERAPPAYSPSYSKPSSSTPSSSTPSSSTPSNSTPRSYAPSSSTPSSFKASSSEPSSSKPSSSTPSGSKPSSSTPSSSEPSSSRVQPASDLDARLDRLFSKLDTLESSLTKKPDESHPQSSSPLNRPTTKVEEKTHSSYSSPSKDMKDSPVRISSPASSRRETSPGQDSYRSPDNWSKSRPDDSFSSYTSSATETPSRTLPDESFDSYQSPSSNASDDRLPKDSFQSPLSSTTGTPSEKRQEVSSVYSPDRSTSSLYSKPFSPRTPVDDSPNKTGDSFHHTPTGQSSKKTEEPFSRERPKTTDTRTERTPEDSSPARDTGTQPFLSPQDEKRYIEKNMDQAAEKLEAKLGEVAPTFKSSYSTTISSPSKTKPPEKPARSSTPKVPYEKVRIEKKDDEPVFKPWNKSSSAEVTKETTEDPASPTYDRPHRQETPVANMHNTPVQPTPADETKSSPSVHFSDPLISEPIYDVPRDWEQNERQEGTAEDSAPPPLPERTSPSPTKKTSSFTDLFKRKDKQDEKGQPDKKEKGDNDDEKKRKWVAMFVEAIKTKKKDDSTDTKGVLSDSEEETDKERADVDEGKKEKRGGWVRDVVERMKQSKSDDELDTVPEVTSDEERAARKDEQQKVTDKVKEGAKKAATRTKDTADKAVEATKEGANRAAHAASESWKQLIAGMKGRDEKREQSGDQKKMREEKDHKSGVTKGPEKTNEHRDDSLPETVVVTEDEAGNVTIESDVSDDLDIDADLEPKQQEKSGWKLPDWSLRSPKLGRKKEQEYDVDMESPVESETVKEKDDDKKGWKLPNIPDIHLKSPDWKFRRDKASGSTSEDETLDKANEKRTGRKGWKEFFSTPDIRSPDWMKRDRSPHRDTDPAKEQPKKEEEEKKGWNFPSVNIKSPDWSFGRDKSPGRSSVSASQEDIMEPEEKKEKRRSKPADEKTETKEEAKEENQKKWRMPEVHAPNINFKSPDWFGKEETLERAPETESSQKIEEPQEEKEKKWKMPEFNALPDWKIRRDKSQEKVEDPGTSDTVEEKGEPKEETNKKWKMPEFHAPDIKIPDSWKIRRDKSQERAEDTESSETEKEGKDPKEEKGKKWKMPEFHAPDIKMPDLKIRRGKSQEKVDDTESSEAVEEKKEPEEGKDKKWKMPEFHAPDFKMPDLKIRRGKSQEKVDDTESSEAVEEKKEPEEGRDKKWKMPEFHAPDFKMPDLKIGRNKSQEKVDDTEPSETVKEKKEPEEGKDKKWKMPQFNAPDFKMPDWKRNRSQENVEETQSSQELNKPDDEKELDGDKDKWKFPDFRAPDIKAPDWKIRRDKSEERKQGAEAPQDSKEPEDKKDTKKWKMPEFHAPDLNFRRDKSPDRQKAQEHPTEINGVEEDEDKDKRKWKFPEFRAPDLKGPDWKYGREKSSEETSEAEMTNGEQEPKVEPKKKKKQTKTWSVPDINLRAPDWKFGSRDDKQRASDEPKEKRKWNLPTMRAPSLNLRAPGTKPSDEDWPMLARSRRGRDVDDVEKAIYIDRRPREFEDVTLSSADEVNASTENGSEDSRSAELPQPVADDIKIAAQRLQSTERLLKMLQNMSDKAINHAVKCEPLEDKGQRDLADSMSDLRPEELTRKDNLQLLDKMSEELMYLYKHKDVPTSPVPWCMGFSVTMRDVYTTLMLHAISMKASLGDLDKILKLYREELDTAIKEEQAAQSKQKRKKKKTKPSSKSKHLERMKDEEEKRLKKKGKKSGRSAPKSKDTERTDYYGRDPSFDVEF